MILNSLEKIIDLFYDDWGDGIANDDFIHVFWNGNQITEGLTWYYGHERAILIFVCGV